MKSRDTFYNALNANDQDSLNFASSGNFLDKMPRDCLRIIKSKSKVRNSRNKPVVAKVSSSTSTPGISSDVAELKDMVKALLLDKKNQSPAPTPVKSVEESCVTCGEYSQEVLGFSNVISSGNPTPYYDPIVSVSSSTLTPFGDCDFLLFEEADSFLAIEDDPTSPEVDPTYYDPDGDILLLEAILNSDPSPPSNQGNYLPEIRKDLKICEANNEKSAVNETPEVELKDLPPHLEYAFLEGNDKLPVIIANDLKNEEKATLIKINTIQRHGRILPSNNLMPYSVWKNLSLPELTPTCMTLELADRSISEPIGIVEDVYVTVGKFQFLADFVVVDFEPDPRVPLILGRSFLKTSHALIDVYEGEITLRVGREAITFNLDQTSRYTANYHRMTANQIDVIDMACEEYSQEVLGFSNVISSGNPTSFMNPTSLRHLRFNCHRDILGQQKNKHFQPIHYASKTMTEAQAHYTTTEKELLAVVYAFEKFRSYLVLSKSIVYTDHSAIKYLFAKKDAKPRLMRWILLLQEFDVVIRDKKRSRESGRRSLPLENPHQNKTREQGNHGNISSRNS
ncbi:reverse transcriptase domain-containing protein [Tanacetum coccineum]